MISAHPLYQGVRVFITAVPIIKLFAWGEGDCGGHVLRETTIRGSGDRFGTPKPRESGSVIGADRNGLGPLVCCRKAGHKAKRRVEVQYSPT